MSSLSPRRAVLAVPFLLAHLAFVATADDPPADLDCTLRPVLAPAARLEFELAFAGDVDGASDLALSTDSGGVLGLGSWIEGVTARDAQGKELAVAHSDANRWTVTHAPGARVVLRYSVAPNERRMDPDPRVHYAPIVEFGSARGGAASADSSPFVHLLGGLALLLPEHLAHGERTLRWRWDALPAGWTAVGVRGVGAGPFTVRDDLEHARNAPLAAGAIDIATRTVHGKPVYVAQRRTGLGFEVGALADLAARIVELERGFFDDWEYPGYVITAVPVGRADGQGSSIGGTGLTDSFAIFLQTGTTLAAPEAGMSIPALLAHEMFHHWNGNRFAFEEPQQTSFWFSEGFTEWFARLLLRRGGFLDDAGWLAAVNRSLEEYASNPARTKTAAELRDAFFTDRSIGQHAYRRGDVLALRIDQELRQRSAGTQSLDDWMRELVLRGTRGETITPERFFALLAERTDRAFADAMRAVAIEGASMTFPADFGAPEFALETRTAHAYELGFDLDATLQTKKIAGTREGSAAWKAGLRDGQELAGLSYYGADASRPVQVTVLEAGARKDLEWMPHGAPIAVPALVRRAK